MPDLSLRFDAHTEHFYSRQLAWLRDRALNDPFVGPVSVEIGSNRGKFLRELSGRDPERFYIGIEWRHKFVELAKEMFEKHGVANAITFRADANLAIPVLFDEGQLQELFVLFPDPWWKSRHRKRRIIQPAFLDILATKMPLGAMIWIRTDVGTLADDMREILDAHPCFEALPFEQFPVEPFPRTNREVTIIAKGLPIHPLYYRRVEA
ncbi:MAG: tRNA (guanosine(46)-N7)-methyltransferase TrmB [Bradymonadaceae bacterium]|nr:tRNA (guanosine(46)-N7)-methyltransferase TrmB [Lujinxingiaceae bacterium]